ncbi:MAG TPA: FCD domain-containing protein [Candidatus Dormibacteraeota bacterium]|nr:FCD domain-containing protein [Candidatus Dormibacteraeota bacterium]
MDVFREVLRRIEDHIEANHLQPGDRLPSDRDLAVALDVSRPLVRQAIKVLESLGRVTAHQGSGTYVQAASHRVAVRELTRGLPFDEDILEQVLPARVGIELEVLRAAFRNRTPEMLQALREALAAREQQRLPDAVRPTAGLDLGFEAALGRACGNEVLRRLQALVHEMWLEAQIAVGVAPAEPESLHQEHAGILDAIERGDLAEAERRLREHLSFLPPPSGG